MGFGSFLKSALDPGDLLGGLSGETGAAAAAEAAEITNAELLRQFELSQENLRPSLEAAQRTLPGLQRQLRTGGFKRTINQLRPELESFLQPTEAGRSRAGLEQLSAAGLSPSSAVGQELSNIDPSTIASLLLGAEADLFGSRLALTGLGEGAGTVLSELGQRTGSGIAQSNINAQLSAQQSKAAGQQNALSLAGLGASFFSDERLKTDIEELCIWKGLRIISWKWKEAVPDSWRDITVGFSAQDVLSKYPQYVSERNGFYSINRDALINHLEAA